MTRLELLGLVVGRARINGFEFRRWYTTRLTLPWISMEASLALLDAQRRYYALVFSHEFAMSFWKPGAEISFDVPSKSFQRAMSDGTIRTIHRRPYMRRSVRPNAWKYHLRQMAVAEEPLRYLRKYLHIHEDLAPEEGSVSLPRLADMSSLAAMPESSGSMARPLPSEPPIFLRRPYRLSEK